MALTFLGGTETTFTSGAVNYKSHTFTASGDLTITGTGTQAMQFLVVGGGGGGALGGGGETNVTTRGNGGGAGGLFYTGSYTMAITYPTWNVVVGAGGQGGSYPATGATNGGTSSFAQQSNRATASVTITGYADGAYIQLTGSVAGRFYITSSTTEVDAPPIYFVASASGVTATTSNLAAKINSLSSSFNIIAAHPGSNLNLTASIGGTVGNSFRFVTGSTVTNLQGGLNAVLNFTGSGGGYGGQPAGGNGGSGGGGNQSGSAIYADSGSAGGLQGGRSGAGGGGATGTGSAATSTWNAPFTIWGGGAGGAGKSYSLQNGTASFYAGGGGGGGDVNIGPGAGGAGGSSIGGNGGSGAAGAGANGAANTGAGGGGGALSDQSSNWGVGGNGGKGVVIITYAV